ncbi:hypothetical protein [Chitinophaga sp. LS1]|uniref:hypothetical protein n=1 Tax=Chitinophaga sp. LS1 TaxID=3051176 RepID=UPI002AAB8A15|nr:hypothetical protein [Chitinophaga sp. LS1]WPV65835.1 hypothetical protein QQL36_28955 [Chitinophaga sp. LS1]
MEYKYYETWMFQNENTEITDSSLENRKVYFRYYFEPSINCHIGQRCLRGKYGDIYYVGKKFEDIWAYHQKIFAEIDYFRLVQHKPNYNIISKKYKRETFIGFLICNCDENYNPKGTSSFNEKYELLEYREAIYSSDQTLQKEKIFIPSLWQTFEEDY